MPVAEEEEKDRPPSSDERYWRNAAMPLLEFLDQPRTRKEIKSWCNSTTPRRVSKLMEEAMDWCLLRGIVVRMANDKGVPTYVAAESPVAKAAALAEREAELAKAAQVRQRPVDPFEPIAVVRLEQIRPATPNMAVRSPAPAPPPPPEPPAPEPPISMQEVVEELVEDVIEEVVEEMFDDLEEDEDDLQDVDESAPEPFPALAPALAPVPEPTPATPAEPKEQNMRSDDAQLTEEEAADYLNVKKPTLQMMRRTERVKYIEDEETGKPAYLRSDLNKYLKEIGKPIPSAVPTRPPNGHAKVSAPEPEGDAEDEAPAVAAAAESEIRKAAVARASGKRTPRPALERILLVIDCLEEDILSKDEALTAITRIAKEARE